MPEDSNSLQQAVVEYDRNSHSGDLETSERQRELVLSRFSVGRWPTLALEEYALGQGDNQTYCWLVERGTPNLGSIRGGSARKLIIYKHRDKPGWYFDPKYPNEQEAWEATRSAFVQAIDLAEHDAFDRIDDLPALKPGPALRAKTLHIYFPDKFLPIASRDHLLHFLRLLRRPEADDKTYDVVRLNRALLAGVRASGLFDGWTTNEIGDFLYAWSDPREAPRVVKIAPGADAKFWGECLSGGYICVGWDEVGDLREFESREAFSAKFTEAYLAGYNNNVQTLRTKAKELWTLTELEPGDLVVANRGKSRILGIGTVVEPGYEWASDRGEMRHILRVKWDTSYDKTITPQGRWAFQTIADVSPALFSEITTGEAKPPDAANPTKKPKPVPVAATDPLFKEIGAALERKKQVVLYGPPGTGKTYTARRFAVSWLLERAGRVHVAQVLADSDAFDREYRGLAAWDPTDKQGIAQVTLLTFHASYSYEDFVEGFRPVPSGDGRVAIRLEDGVFKRVCRAASAHPDRPYVVIIDEINRANIAKVLGELITLLEHDKRGVPVVLPQSKESFVVPGNVFIVATMNTADRSIKLLDAALRRRFAFIELMPDLRLLEGATVGTLSLDSFVFQLNERIARKEGREKQIGHSFFLERGDPVEDPVEFARRFRHDVLPLLQEYCYEDYGTLAGYLGDSLVDREAQTLKHDVLNDPDELIAALSREYRPRGESA